MAFSLPTAAHQLRQCRTTSAIRRFRAGLSKDQAQAVMRALDSVERGAVLLALHLGGEATIIEPQEVGLPHPARRPPANPLTVAGRLTTRIPRG